MWIRIRIQHLSECGSNTDPDPDPQHFFERILLEIIIIPRFSGYVHDEEVQEGAERANKDYLMLFFSDTGLHMLREATDLFVGKL